MLRSVFFFVVVTVGALEFVVHRHRVRGPDGLDRNHDGAVPGRAAFGHPAHDLEASVVVRVSCAGRPAVHGYDFVADAVGGRGADDGLEGRLEEASLGGPDRAAEGDERRCRADDGRVSRPVAECDGGCPLDAVPFVKVLHDGEWHEGKGFVTQEDGAEQKG